MIICFYRTSTWTNKATGRKILGMVQCIYALMKSVYDENYYSPGQAFDYSVVRVNPKLKGDLNLVKIDLLRKLGILLQYFSSCLIFAL